MLSAYALRLLILTATRTKEVIESQFEEFDLQRKIWTIPVNKMKVKKKHKEPLSNEAISIIELMRNKHNHDYVFTNPVTGRHISNGAMIIFFNVEEVNEDALRFFFSFSLIVVFDFLQPYLERLFFFP